MTQSLRIDSYLQIIPALLNTDTLEIKQLVA